MINIKTVFEKVKNTVVLVFMSAMLFQCQEGAKKKDIQPDKNKVTTTSNTMNVITSVYGTTKSGEEIRSFRITNNNVAIEIIEYGAIVTSVKCPDKDGTIDDITLGYDTLEGWENDPYYFGATIGRVANRTGGASFKLDGNTYNLAPNTLPDFGKNHLHGGVKPFNKVAWKGSEFQNKNEVGVVLKYLSKDGEEGYPGNLSCQVTYSLNNENELKITYTATTDKTTIVNMTHHSYFNLEGAGNGTVFEQEIHVNADKYTVADDDLIPTGEIANVTGLPIDFTTQQAIGSRMDRMGQKKFKGYDLNYVLNHSKKDSLEYAGKAIDLKNGRVLEVFTTQPCMHFYTGNFLEGKAGKNGEKYSQYGAFCFEPQGYPDAINKPQFNSIVLEPREKYEQIIIYKFSVQK